MYKKYNKTSDHAFKKSFGNSFTEDFYKPFFIKVFGRNLKTLSDEQFKRRVATSSIANIIFKIISNLFKNKMISIIIQIKE